MKSAAVELPALNPNQPTHSRLAPMLVSTSECGALGTLGYPARLPIMDATVSPEAPDETWTTMPPAKSMAPREWRNAPSPPHTWCASGQYTAVLHRMAKAQTAVSLSLSANAPEMIAVVMHANMQWKVTKMLAG